MIKDREKYNQYRRDYYHKNKSKVRNTTEKWKKKNQIRVNIAHKKYVRKIRIEVINHYGGKCNCCGEKQFEFLCIDHIFGNGNQHRKLISSQALPHFIKKNNYPDEFQILCYNCNAARYIHKYCPHQKSIL